MIPSVIHPMISIVRSVSLWIIIMMGESIRLLSIVHWEYDNGTEELWPLPFIPIIFTSSTVTDNKILY